MESVNTVEGKVVEMMPTFFFGGGVVRERVDLCIPGCPGTSSVDCRSAFICLLNAGIRRCVPPMPCQLAIKASREPHGYFSGQILVFVVIHANSQ